MAASTTDLKSLAVRTAVIVLTALCLIALALLLWKILSVLLLIFGAALIAILFSSIGRWIAQKLGLSYTLGLIISLLLIGITVGSAAWLMMTQVSGQFDQLSGAIPSSWEDVRTHLQERAWGRLLIDEVENFNVGALAGNVAFTALGAVGNVVLIIVGALYLAVQPDLYRSGVLALVPQPSKQRVAVALDESGFALTQWLKAQFLSMLAVGTLTAAGLWLLGMPSALALGVIAGLAEFVPYVGPIAAAIPALLVASSESGSMLLWVAGLYLLIQQIESNLIMPIFTRKLVYLPPALTVFSIVAFTLVFGLLGALFAAPLTVFFYLLVGKLYVEGTLHRKAELPTE